jgi:hypothetical protein
MDNIRITTPKGIAKYPRLNKADTKFDENGVYKVDLVMPAKEAEGFVKKVTAIRDEAFKASKMKKKAKLPFEKELNDDGDETGNIIIRCKAKNVVTKKGDLWDRKPKQFDAAGQRIDVNIGGGSELKLNCEVYIWEAASMGLGVTLQPVAVQVIKLVEYGNEASADDFGFEKEDGFVSDESFQEEGDSDGSSISDEETEDADLY